MGLCVGPDDMYPGAARPAHDGGAAGAAPAVGRSTVARWLEQRPEVARVLHPALDSDPGHAIWKRDFTGASGLFSDRAQAGAAKRRCTPSSTRSRCSAWAIPGAASRASSSRSTAATYRTATHWAPGGPTLRFHIGLEDAGDLIADLERGFAATGGRGIVRLRRRRVACGRRSRSTNCRLRR